MRKYNPFLKTMVDNYRTKAEKLGLSTTNYTDEQLFNVIEYWSQTSSSEEQIEAVMDDLKEGTHRP